MSEAPRTLFLVESFSAASATWGGVQITLRRLAEGLAPGGGLTVLAPVRLWPPLPRYRQPRAAQAAELAAARAADGRDGIRVLRPAYLHLPLLWWIAEPVQLFCLGLWAVLARTGRPAVFHGHRAYPMGLTAVWLGRCLGRPAVVSVYGSDVHTEAASGPLAVRYWTRRALRGAARVIAVSQSLMDGVAALGVGAERCRYVPSGVDLERFVPREARAARAALGLPPEARVVLCISQFYPIKGHTVLVEAFRRLAERRADALMVLTGDGPLRPTVEAAVREAGLAGRTRFTGTVPYDAVPAWLAAADLMVLPSYNEGMPLSVLEALACGRPVIASRVGGTPELVSDARYGLLVPPGDPAALAAALEEALARPWNAAELRARAAEFGWPEIVARVRAVYAEAVAG
jgi:glycosyltransferase involved in cell wall biosynthesis